MSAPLTVAVIGHVNHGKTALTRALTGIETDRLKEEIERGLSITLGFAWRAYPSATIDLIDAPGHEDFIRAMATGTAGARAVLLVVSAIEGFRPQTWEHLHIAALLGIRAGVVAVTKTDLLGPGDEAAARAGIEAALADTFLAGEPVLLCSAISGAGLAPLHQALEALPARCAPAPALEGAFLPLDRVFTVAGVGAVATGTLQGGPLQVGDHAILEPSGLRVDLRQIQIHGREAARAEPGGRVAVALRGVTASEVRAGEVLCAPGAFQAAEQVDVQVTVPPDSPRPLKHLDEVAVLWGARRDMARARLFGAGSIGPGETGFARLRFSGPVIAFAGQAAILRRPSPPGTIGGVVVLDPVTPSGRGNPRDRRDLLETVSAGNVEAIAANLARRDGDVVSAAEAARLSRLSTAQVRERLAGDYADLDTGRLASRSALTAIRRDYLDALAKAHRDAPARPAAAVRAIRDQAARRLSRDLVAEVERRLATDGQIRLVGGEVALAGHDPLTAMSAEALARLADIEAALREGGVKPPGLAALPDAGPEDADLVSLLVWSGRAVSLRNVGLRQTLVFHPDALDAAIEALRMAFPPPREFTTGEAREALGATRKFIVPILEHFDAVGLTTRHGDVRQVSKPPTAADTG